MRLPRVRVTVRRLLLGIAFLALVGTVALQQKELDEVRPRVRLMEEIAEFERQHSRTARRESALRTIFGDLGLMILRDGERVEVLRAVNHRAGGPPDAVPTGRVLHHVFAQRLAHVILDEAGLEISDCQMPLPWTVGFRVWRRDESLDVFYEKPHGSFLSVRVVVRDWKGKVWHDTGDWQCIEHRSLGDLVKEIEGPGSKVSPR